MHLTHSTVKSWFKKVHFFFLKSRLVWFKKDLCSESKNRLPPKNPLCRWISNLRSFLNQDITVIEIFYQDQMTFVDFLVTTDYNCRNMLPRSSDICGLFGHYSSRNILPRSSDICGLFGHYSRRNILARSSDICGLLGHS